MRKYTSVAAAVYSTLALSWWIWKWASVLGLSGIIASFWISSSTWWVTILVLSVQVFTVSAGLALYFWLQNSNRQADAANPHLQVTRFSSTYYVRVNHEYELVQEISVKAKRVGVDRYLAKFRWTGAGDCRASVEPSSLELVKRGRDAEGFFEVQEIKFDRMLKRGEERSFVMTLKMQDDSRTAQPFVAKTVNDDYPNGFSQRVCLPSVPKRYSIQVYHTSHSQIPLQDVPNEKPDSAEIMQNIGVALFDERYVVRWSLDKEIQ